MNRIVIIVLTTILVIILISFVANSTQRINAGHEGILVKLYGTEKGVQDVSLVTGRVWFNPFTEEVFEFPTYVQTADYDPFSVNAKDGSVFSVDPTISFYIMTGKSPHIFMKYRKDIGEITRTTLLNYVKDAFRIQMNKYSTDELISNRQKFEADVQETLNNSISQDGFKLEQLTSGLQYPETIVQAIDLKNKAVQQAMQVENELKVAEMQSRKKIIEAEADARSNELRQKTLTPLLIQQQFIDKWDGHTPLYGNAPVLFQSVK
jgi:regulator of protease activity HflC (stomatin/prohibitin superfamily)